MFNSTVRTVFIALVSTAMAMTIAALAMSATPAFASTSLVLHPCFSVV